MVYLVFFVISVILSLFCFHVSDKVGCPVGIFFFSLPIIKGIYNGVYSTTAGEIMAIIGGGFVALIIDEIISENKMTKKNEAEYEAAKPEIERRIKEKQMGNSIDQNKIKATELKGMKFVMDHENPFASITSSLEVNDCKDVSSENLGYDIQSNRSSGVRFIEVKAKSTEGNILITNNEWDTAKRYREKYYLYVVLNCDSKYPNLYIIQDPANKLDPEFNNNTKKYSVSISQIKEYSNHS